MNEPTSSKEVENDGRTRNNEVDLPVLVDEASNGTLHASQTVIVDNRMPTVAADAHEEISAERKEKGEKRKRSKVKAIFRHPRTLVFLYSLSPHGDDVRANRCLAYSAERGSTFPNGIYTQRCTHMLPSRMP